MQIDPSLEQLRSFVSLLHPLESGIWEEFAAIWQPFSARRKTVLTAAGETERHLYFVREGVQRAYYLHESGREATLVFTYSGSFSGVADSFLLQRPSKYFLETLTTSTLLRTTYGQVAALMEKHHGFETFIRKTLAATLAGTLERQIELQCFSAEERFRALLTRSPHVLRLIPHKYLASYLGIDATTFSRLLGSIRL
ncbi:cyclic nucleotide-binding domain-containing protein [Paraflavisolibacter sp. H34]|uniref:Crp/Fnr family transcriptional regulator n=1 Tax=Huijunlia imazamoxiresistens TaxID=3127457 RepID=UPI0030187BC5